MKIRRIIQFLLVSILVLGAFGSATPQDVNAAHAHPLLLELASEEPGQMVRVIVQKTPGAQGVEALVTSLGGKVTQDLSIIDAFAAEMDARAAVKLSHANTIRWVSPDAAVLQPSNCSQ